MNVCTDECMCVQVRGGSFYLIFALPDLHCPDVRMCVQIRGGMHTVRATHASHIPRRLEQKHGCYCNRCEWLFALVYVCVCVCVHMYISRR